MSPVPAGGYSLHLKPFRRKLLFVYLLHQPGKPMNQIPYGSWQSPISSAVIAQGSVGLGQLSAAEGNLYWVETRNGINTLVEYASGNLRDLLSPEFSIRSSVHEYGGISYLVAGGSLYFVNFTDQQIYTSPVDAAGAAACRQLTSEAGTRFVDIQLDARRHRLLCIAERHDKDLPEPHNYLAEVDLDTGQVGSVAEGEDFYSSPRLSPDGSQLTFISWKHPNMPWDETQLWLMNTATGELTEVAGNSPGAKVQPGFDDKGRLIFSSDHNDWWNLYRLDKPGVVPVQLTDLHAETADPHWVFGQQNYFCLADGRMLLIVNQQTRDQLALLEGDHDVRTIEQPFSSISSAALLHDHQVAMIGAGPDTLPQVVHLDLRDGRLEVLKQSTSDKVNRLLKETGLSVPRAIEFPTSRGRTAHGFFYPPMNADFRGPADSRPPLIVELHGGPTSHTDTALSLMVQYWTSRGFALLDVNYSGSTGYGREYRQRLNGEWGVVDLDDAEAGVQHLIGAELVDGNRIVIHGGSAGGFSALAALTFRSTFQAGAIYYGISDLTALAEDTHKFESRYLDRLIGPYPEAKETYLARSPIYHLNELDRPIIFFQGLEDKIVPPDQTQRMAQALEDKGLPVACLEFEGEGHGFRLPGNIRRALDAELYFYSRVFGFLPGDDLEPVEIANLPAAAPDG